MPRTAVSASFRVGWRVFREELPAALTPRRIRITAIATLSATIAVVALLPLLPLGSTLDRVGYTSITALIGASFAAGVTLLVVTRADRRGFSPRRPRWDEQKAVESAHANGRYDELPDDLRQSLIDGARHLCRTLPVFAFAGLIISVPLTCGGLILFVASFPDPLFPGPVVTGLIFTVVTLLSTRPLAQTEAVLRFAD